MKAFLASCIALLILGSCSKAISPTEPTATNGKLIVTVVDTASGSGVAGVTVEIRKAPAGPVAFTAVTDARGTVGIVVPAGTYWVDTIVPAGYSPAASTLATQAQLTVRAGETAAVTISVAKQ